MVDWINDKKNWQPAQDQVGNDRTDACVINATDIIPLTDYPPGTNLFLRAEPLHPGAILRALRSSGPVPCRRVSVRSKTLRVWRARGDIKAQNAGAQRRHRLSLVGRDVGFSQGSAEVLQRREPATGKATAIKVFHARFPPR